MRETDAESFGSAPVCGALSVLAFAGALAVLGYLPPTVGLVAGLLVFSVGAAFGPVVRLSPVEPSLLKLVTLSALFSPVLAGAVYTLLHLSLAADVAVAGSFVACGVLAATGIGGRVARPRLSRAGRLSLVLAAVCGILVLLLLFRGSLARVSYHGLLHSALLLASDRALPPTNPFLAGEPLAYYWYWHAQGALVARGMFLAPTHALALANLWAAIVLPLALYFLAAPFAGEGRRELAGVVLAVFGLNALGGWLWVLDGFPWTEPETSLEVLHVLGGAVGGWDSRLAFGFSKFGNLSSYPASLALLAGTWTCAAHALRHGRQPWVGAMAVLGGATLLVNPVVGGTALFVVGVAALLFSPGLRVRLVLPLVGCALPGAYLAYEAGSGYSGTTLGFELSTARLVGVVLPVSLLLVPGVFALRRERPGDEERRGRVLGLLLIASAVPLALAAVVELPYDNQYKLVRIAALPLGLLAGKGLFDLWDARGARRALGVAVGLALGLGVSANNALGFATYLSFAEREAPLVEGPLALGPDWRAGVAAFRAASYDGLRSLPAAERPVLVVDVLEEEPQLLTGFAFTDPVRNLQGHEAAAFAGMDLWCDRPSQALDANAGALRERLEVVWRLFHDPSAMAPADRDFLVALGRPVLVLVSGYDAGRDAGVAKKLERAGFTKVTITVPAIDYFDTIWDAVYAWPEEFAERVSLELTGGERP